VCRDVVSCDAVLSSDEEADTTGSVQCDRLAVAGSYSTDRCRKSLKLTSDQLVSSSDLSVTGSSLTASIILRQIVNDASNVV